jgi:threonine/homoserine/homoserine lactone efflux protein
MIEDILTGIPLGIFLSFLIGPVFFVLLETSAVKGFRAALVFDLGVVLADVFFIAIAYFSSYRLIQSIKGNPAIFIFGGILMMTYGLVSFIRLRKIGKNTDIDDDVLVVGLIKKNYMNLFIKGFLLNFINVGVLLFWFLILITIGPKLDLETSRMLTFFTSVILTYLIVDIGKMLLAKQLRHKLTPANILKIKKVISIVLIIFGLTIMFQGWFPSDQKMVRQALEKME